MTRIAAATVTARIRMATPDPADRSLIHPTTLTCSLAHASSLSASSPLSHSTHSPRLHPALPAFPTSGQALVRGFFTSGSATSLAAPHRNLQYALQRSLASCQDSQMHRSDGQRRGRLVRARLQAVSRQRSGYSPQSLYRHWQLDSRHSAGISHAGSDADCNDSQNSGISRTARPHPVAR